MKRSIACALAVMTMASVPMAVYADNVTHLTTTVPDATYILNIPADQEIAFGTTSKTLGAVTVTESSGFALGKNLKVTVEHNDFVAENVSTTIPYKLKGYMTEGYASPQDYDLSQGLIFYGNSRNDELHEYPEGEGETTRHDIESIEFTAKSSDWGRALGGDYHSEITFTAEVVVE